MNTFHKTVTEVSEHYKVTGTIAENCALN